MWNKDVWTVGDNVNFNYVDFLSSSDKKLIKKFFLQIPGENYDPDKFTFHMTLHIDKDKKLVNKIKEDIELNFKSFDLEFDELVLYDYPGDMIKEISIKE